MVDLLRFVRDLAGDQAARDRFRADPSGALEHLVDDADDVTGEDVEAVAEVAAPGVAVPRPVRPVGAEAPRDAAVRVLVGLCDALDGPAVEPVTLPHREHRPDPPMPAEVARGGGAPVPTEPPGERWLHPVIPSDDGAD